jgi:SAM-dependent methyltransferase
LQKVDKMTTALRFVLIVVGVVLLTLGALYVLVPALYGVPSVSTRAERIRKALRLAGLRSGETLYDLGSGNGRALVIAAREFGARAVGIEIGPVQCLVSWLNARLNGVGSRVRVKRADFYRADLREADVVFVYLTSAQTSRLQARLEEQLRGGARVVAVSADFRGWQPSAFDNEDLLFLYRMPREDSTPVP